MKYLIENKVLLKKYLLIITFNIIIYILTSFYLKSSDTQTIIMLLIVLVSDLIIHSYKGRVVFKYYLDIIANIVSGLLLLIFIKEIYIYSTTTFSLYLANNIVFMRSRISEKFWKRSIQYMLSFILTVLCMFITLFIAIYLIK